MTLADLGFQEPVLLAAQVRQKPGIKRVPPALLGLRVLLVVEYLIGHDRFHELVDDRVVLGLALVGDLVQQPGRIDVGVRGIRQAAAQFPEPVPQGDSRRHESVYIQGVDVELGLEFLLQLVLHLLVARPFGDTFIHGQP